MALPVGFYGSLQWIGWLSLLDEVALNHWNTQCVRSGYHCAPYVHGFIKSKQYNGTVRISLGYFNTIEQIDLLLEALNSL